MKWNTLMHSDVVNGDDIGMIESGSCPRFLLEAGQSVGIFRGRGTDQLEGDIAPQALVPGAINLTHTAAADLLQNLIVT